MQSYCSEKRTNLDYLMLLWGCVSAMPIVSFMHITVFVWGMFAFLFFLTFSIFNKGYISGLKTLEFSYILFFAVSVLSSIYSLISLPSVWLEGWGNRMIQYIICFIFYITFIGSRKTKLVKNFVDGVFISAVIQLFWGYAQYILYTIAKVDLNRVVFVNLLHMLRSGDTASHLTDGGIKVSGMCWNAGNFAPLVLFGFVYAKNIYLKVLFLIMALLCGSRTALIGVGTYLALLVIIHFKSIYQKAKKKVVSIIVISLGLIICVVSFSGLIVSYIDKVQETLYSIINYTENGSSMTHLGYFLEIPQILKHNSILHNLIGYGHGCSGIVYPKYPNALSGERWTAECDPVNYLWSYGIIGFALYYVWLVRNILNVKRINKDASLFFVAFMVEGLGYNVTWDWMKLLMISLFVLYRNRCDVFTDNNELESKVLTSLGIHFGISGVHV